MKVVLPRVGDIIDDKYELAELIGEGGFALVFRATDVVIERPVAVKILKPSDTGYAVTVASRFAREARALAELTDTHTLRLFDFGRSESGVLYMVSELLPGQDLRDVMAERSLSEEEAVHIMRQLLSSLREAHRANILHRDIKPSNIQVFQHFDDPLFVKLIDFGIARPTGPDAQKLTQTGAVIGTPRYMSPEQAVGATVTPGSDLYSLGLVVVEMLTGDPRAPLQAMVSGQRLELPASPKLSAVLEQMLEWEVADRFGSAEQVLAALDRPMSSGEVIQRPSPSRESSPSVAPMTPSGFQQPPARPHVRPQWLAIAAIAIVVVVFGLGVVSLSRRQATSTVTAPEPTTARDNPLTKTIPEATPLPSLSDASVVVAEADAGEGADASSMSGCGTARPEGPVELTEKTDWARVDWTAWVPRGYDPNVAVPVVMLIHGSDGQARDLLIDGGASKVADREGFIAVAPQGNDTWSFVAEESDTFRVIIDRMISDYCVDEEQIYVIGHDTGGAAAERLSCVPWVAGTATTSFRPLQPVTSCDKPSPHMIFSPLGSRHLPPDGGRQCVGRAMISVGAYEETWRKRNECRGEPRRVLKRGRTECWEWRCGAPLSSCHVDGGHNWRGMSPRRFDILSCDGVPAKFDYMGAAWKFFEAVGGG